MIKFSDGGKHIYTYDASGRKLRAEHHVPVVVAAEPQIPIEDWLEPIEILEQPYEEPQIPDDAVQMPEEQPGGLMGESTGSDAQPYKYNGKELDRHSGLDWYDYGARWYNGLSWMTPDPVGGEILRHQSVCILFGESCEVY